MRNSEYNDFHFRNVFGSPDFETHDTYNIGYFKERSQKWEQNSKYPVFMTSEYFRAPEWMYNNTERIILNSVREQQVQQSLNQVAGSLVRSVTMMAAGAVVVVNAYNTMVKEQETAMIADEVSVSDPNGDSGEQFDPSAQYDYSQIEWVWSEDGMTVTAIIPGIDDIIKAITITPDITFETKDATCTEDGFRITTATLQAPDGAIYTDVRETVLPATGHSFEELTVDESSIIYQCPNCGSEIKVEITVQENPAP